MQQTTRAPSGGRGDPRGSTRDQALRHPRGTNRRFSSIAEQLPNEPCRTDARLVSQRPLVQVCRRPHLVSAVIWTASALAAQDKLTPGEFVAFVTAMSMLFEPIRRLTNINAVIQRGLAGAQSIFELLDTLPEPDPASTSSRTAPCHWRAALRPVCFRYPDQRRLGHRETSASRSRPAKRW